MVAHTLLLARLALQDQTSELMIDLIEEDEC